MNKKETRKPRDFRKKNLKDKRSNLQEGKFIEIPVIPYKR